MCGRFVIFSEAQEREIESIVEEINRKYNWQGTGEIYPTGFSPIVTYDNSERYINLFKWGFPNYKGGMIINARSETLMEKRMFRESFIHHRCLIPATAFFEWKQVDGSKKKYIIRSSEAGMFYMAGIYDGFIDMSGQPFTAFVVITTSASDKMSTIHDRMPVILNKKSDIDLWTNNELKDIQKLKALLSPNDEIIIAPS